MRSMVALLLRCLLTGILLATIGCTAGYGRLSRSREVDDLFTRYEVRPGYRYYTFGSHNAPLAIMGIDSAYTLTTTVWRAIPEMTPALLQTRVEAMTDQLGFSPANFGGRLLTPDGVPFGIWYSPFMNTVIKFGDNNTVMVSPPRRSEHGEDGPRRRMID